MSFAKFNLTNWYSKRNAEIQDRQNMRIESEAAEKITIIPRKEMLEKIMNSSTAEHITHCKFYKMQQEIFETQITSAMSLLECTRAQFTCGCMFLRMKKTLPELKIDKQFMIEAFNKPDYPFKLCRFGTEPDTDWKRELQQQVWKKLASSAIVEWIFPLVNKNLLTLIVDFREADFSTTSSRHNILHEIADSFPNLQHLEIYGDSSRRMNGYSYRERKDLFTGKFQKLEVLKLDFVITHNLLQNLLKVVCHNLKELSLNCMHLRNDPANDEVELDLQEQNLPNSFLDNCTFTNLLRLRLINVWVPRILKNLPQKCPELKSICIIVDPVPSNKLAWREWNAGPEFYGLMTNLQQVYLHELDRYCRKSVEDDAIGSPVYSSDLRNLFNSLTHIRDVFISGMPNINWEIRKLSSVATERLAFLRISGCFSMHIEDLNALQRMPHLKKLSIANCGLPHILKFLPENLQFFSAEGSKEILLDTQTLTKCFKKLKFADFSNIEFGRTNHLILLSHWRQRAINLPNIQHQLFCSDLKRKLTELTYTEAQFDEAVTQTQDGPQFTIPRKPQNLQIFLDNSAFIRKIYEN